MLVFILILIIAALLAVILLIERKAQKLQKELSQTKEQLKSQGTSVTKELELKDEIYLAMNAIHIYASLTEEETKVQSIKEKQNQIIEICENILKYKI